MGHALVIGAGAIGRGFLPWVLDGMQIDYFDASIELTAEITARSGYHSYRSFNGELQSQWIDAEVVTHDFDVLDIQSYDVAFVSVGPRNVARLPKGLGNLSCPVFSLENDPTSVDVIRKTYGLDSVYFGVPDVITSSTASPINLAHDPLAIHTEDGVLYLEDPGVNFEKLHSLLPRVSWLPAIQLRREWAAKLYLHNTPHCVAAYLGRIAGFDYVHEGFTKPSIERIVTGVVEEMLLTLKLTMPYDHAFLESYATKELRRFSNPLLFDPVARVAREPLRKLAPTGRLTGALRLAMSSGVDPINLMLGIAGALHYDDVADPDVIFLDRLNDFGVPAFLKYHLGIQIHTMESQYIANKNTAAWSHLERFVR
jgi:hypothetical protein